MENEKTKSAIKQRNKEYASQFWRLIRVQVDKFSASVPTPSSPPVPPRQTAKYQWLLNILFAVPYILAAVFIFSFFWDFNGVTAFLFGIEFNFEGVLRMVSISGLIGFLTNWLAITMLFRPTNRRPLLGQGLIPAQKDRIAFRLSSAVAEDLINPEIIKKKIHESQVISKYREKATVYVKNVIDDPEFRQNLKSLVFNYVDEMIADPEVRNKIASTLMQQIDDAVAENSFEKVALRAYSFFKGQEMQDLVEEALHKLPNGIEKGLDKMDSFLDNLPVTLQQHSGMIEELVTNLLYKLINQLDVHALVEDNLKQYNERKLEMLIKNASNDQLHYIQYLGAVLGTFGGFIIWEPIASLTVLLIIISSTVLLDQIIFHLKNKSHPQKIKSDQNE